MESSTTPRRDSSSSSSSSSSTGGGGIAATFVDIGHQFFEANTPIILSSFKCSETDPKNTARNDDEGSAAAAAAAAKLTASSAPGLPFFSSPEKTKECHHHYGESSKEQQQKVERHAHSDQILDSKRRKDEESSKPCYFPLCTKCATEGKEKLTQPSTNESEDADSELIIQSASFKSASHTRPQESDNRDLSREFLQTPQSSMGKVSHPIFDRSKIIHETALLGFRDSSSSSSTDKHGGISGVNTKEGREVEEEEILLNVNALKKRFEEAKDGWLLLLPSSPSITIAYGSKITDFYDTNVGSLGKGSYGSVAKARELRSGILRAVKIVYKPRVENIMRLKREILIIKLFEVYEDPKNLYLVMEMCSGGELFDRIIKNGHFSERYAASLMKQMLSACAYCHSNDVMHRDLKPENLLYADASPLSALKVIDWGFAARCSKSHKFSSVVGTPYYVAPEVLFGNYDKRCDLWSAGVILYILLCGYPPFHGKDNQDILRKVKIGDYNFDPRHWKRVSDHAKDLIQRCLTYDPRKRISAKDALQHPWIQFYTQGSPGSDPLSTKLGGDLLDKFKNFQRFNKMKRLAITCVAYQLSEKDIGTLHDLFSALDVNGDGVLSCSEVEQGLVHLGLRFGNDMFDLLKELDTDGNGTIDYTEFLAASIDHKLYEQESVCRAAFRVFDLDGDGRITIDELHKMLELNFVQEAFSREMVEEIVQEVDLDKDGSIDFNEFMRMMRGRQKKLTDSSAFSKARSLISRQFE